MRFLGLVCFMFMSFSSFAQIESVIQFRGQNGEVIKVDKNINVVRPVGYEVPHTCTRDIPYQSYECNDVTRYRQECSWIPESQNCYTEYDRVCRSVTRYRNECHRGPDRQQCHDVPGREVCVERPTREVCRTDSNGQQRCTTVGGGQSCHTTGGGRECDTVPGEQICRDVAYTDEDCDNVPRQRCDTVPGRNECRDIPYSENVCGNVTRYRQEPYACTRTEYRDVTTAKKLNGQIDIRFVTNGLVEEFPLQIKVDAPNAKFEAFAATVKLMKEPKVFVILRKKTVKAVESEKEITLQGEVIFEVVEEKFVAPTFPASFKNGSFDESTSVLSLGIEGQIAALGSADLLFEAKPMIGKKRKIAELKAGYPSQLINIKGSNLEFNLAAHMQNGLTKKNYVTLKLTAPLSVQGELLNSRKPVMEKSFSLEVRK